MLSSAADYGAVLALVNGDEDLALLSAVQVRGKTAVAPNHTVRQALVPVVDLSAEAEDFKPHNSARLVCFGGKCLGDAAGGLCFAFRGEAPSAEAAQKAEVLENEV